MDIIHKQNNYISTKKHLEFLNGLKVAQQNYINGVFVVSKSLQEKAYSQKTKQDLEKDKVVLDSIEKSISYYQDLQE